MIGYIYIILNLKKINRIYIGSTTVSVKSRFKKHISNRNTKSKKNRPIYKDMRKYGTNMFFCYCIEVVDYKNKKELLEREKYYINYYKNLNYNLYNQLSPRRTIEERRKQYKKYYYNNKEKIKRYSDNRNKIKYICYCDKNRLLTYTNKARHEKSEYHQSFITKNINNIRKIVIINNYNK
jgi:hypothetical protein